MVSWSGRRWGHLSACHLPTARTCAWRHGLDGDEDTCLHVTCQQQGQVHGVMVWTEMRTPVCMSPANSKDMCMVSWSGRRRGHLSACHLLAARKCAWFHGLDRDEDTCLHVTCWQQGHVHGVMVWTETRTPVCMSPAGSKDMCMVSWSGRRQGHLSVCHLLAARKCAWFHGLDRDEDTCLHVTCRQQGNVHGVMVWTEMRTPVCMSPTGSKEMCMIFGIEE